jgi:hypothetical protein
MIKIPSMLGQSPKIIRFYHIIQKPARPQGLISIIDEELKGK